MVGTATFLAGIVCLSPASSLVTVCRPSPHETSSWCVHHVHVVVDGDGGQKVVVVVSIVVRTLSMSSVSLLTYASGALCLYYVSDCLIVHVAHPLRSSCAVDDSLSSCLLSVPRRPRLSRRFVSYPILSTTCLVWQVAVYVDVNTTTAPATTPTSPAVTLAPAVSSPSPTVVGKLTMNPR